MKSNTVKFTCKAIAGLIVRPGFNIFKEAAVNSGDSHRIKEFLQGWLCK
jgi:hypothetical protein